MWKHKKRIKGMLVVAMVIMLLVMCGISAYANTLSGRYRSGNIFYGYAGLYTDIYLTTLSKHVEKWDAVTTKISMSKSSYSSSNLKIRYCLDAPPQSGSLGVTTVYDESGNQQAFSGYWYSALCVVYNNDVASTTNKYATLIHEVGHALSMDHCTHLNQNHIMHQGLKDFTTISAYEKGELKLVWGDLST